MPVESYGVRVHPRSEWPFPHLSSSPSRTALLAPDTPVHTTQTHVYEDHLDNKATNLDNEVVTVAVEPLAIGQRIWIVDGHHTLIAARHAGRAVKVEIHGPGHDRIAAPRLYKRTTTPQE